MLQGLSDWWDDVELWVAQLPFPFQFALVMAVLLPVCLVVAWLIDRLVDYTSATFGPAEDTDPALGSAPAPFAEPSAEVRAPADGPVEVEAAERAPGS